jgi:hypothetical protein
MHIFLRCCLRLAIVAAGLLLVGLTAVMFVVLLALWAVRSTWLKVTGRPATPWVMRFGAREVFRRAHRGPSTREVIDVEARRLR